MSEVELDHLSEQYGYLLSKFGSLERERDRLRARVKELEAAIRIHRDDIREHISEPVVLDYELWAILGEENAPEAEETD